MVWAAAFTEAIGEGVEILLVDGLQEHRYCPLDDLVLKGWHSNRSLTSILFVEPRPHNRRRLIPSGAESLVKVSEVSFEILGILLSRDPIYSWSTPFGGPVERLAQEIHVNVVCQSREDTIWILDCLVCNLLEGCGYGW
jgi:hypothetical protein